MYFAVPCAPYPPANARSYLAVPFIPYPPVDDQKVADESNKPQQPDSYPENDVRHEILAGRELIWGRVAGADIWCQTAEPELISLSGN